MFTCAEVKRDSSPAPAVDEYLQRYIGWCYRARRDAWLLPVAYNLLAPYPTWTVLRTYQIRFDFMTGQWLQGMQDFDLFIAYRISIEGDGGFHGDQGEQLEHLVLHHAADGSYPSIVSPPTSQPHT